MWRRTYLFLAVVRLWFALSPSYLHPDENFQGPEVIAGTWQIRLLCLTSDSAWHGRWSRHGRAWRACLIGTATVAGLGRVRPGLSGAAGQRWAALGGGVPGVGHTSEAVADSGRALGEIFSYPVRHTWEFTSDNPIRSVFPLWPVYGLPMLLLRWLWIGKGNDGDIPPITVFWTLRVLMFIVGFVLEDWAIHELIPSQRHRRYAMLLVASSYVTWTFQTHTFSNSIETLVVAWSLVLIERIVSSPVGTLHTHGVWRWNLWADPTQQRGSVLASIVLGIVAVFGVFNRITFPAFLLIPGLRLLDYYRKK